MGAVQGHGPSVIGGGGKEVGAEASPVKEKQSNGRTYLVVNEKADQIGFTRDAKFASTYKEVKNFLDNHRSKMDASQFNQLVLLNERNKISNRIIVSIKNSIIPNSLKNIFIKIAKFARKMFEGGGGVHFVESEVNVVRVGTKESEKFSVPTNFADQNNRKTGIRAAEDKNTVKDHMKEHYKDKPVPSGVNLTSGVEMETLANQKSAVSFDQLRMATFNKMKEFKLFKEESAAFEAELNAVLQEIEEGKLSINNLDELKEIVKTRLKNNNAKEEMIDRETFADLTQITAVAESIPLDVMNAPEYKDLKKSFHDGTWADGEERKLTFTNFRESDMEKLNAGIDSYFADPTTQKVLEQFLTPRKDGSE